jgi:hypothetical protein
MINIDLLQNDDFIKKLQEIELSEYEKDAIYMYLSLFNEDLSDEEKSLWYDILNNESKNDDEQKNKGTDAEEL